MRLLGELAVAKTKVFVSFDYADLDMKGAFVSQAKRQDVPISITDLSLVEPEPNQEWVADANRRIAACDVFMVIMGQNAFQAPGVVREVSIAAGLGKFRFQLKPMRRYGPPVKDAGEVVPWKWERLVPLLTSDRSRLQARRARG